MVDEIYEINEFDEICESFETHEKKEIDNIKIRLTNIENKLDDLLNLIDNNVVTNCNRMGDHINFVENVYHILRSPLEFISNRINIITNNQPKLLPNTSY